MFMNFVLNKIKNELDSVSFEYDGEAMICGFENGVWTAKIFNGDKSYVVKYYENGCNSLHNYRILEKYGIKTNRIEVESSNILIFNDLSFSEEYRKANEIDLDNIKVVSLIAKFYKKFHECPNDFVYEDVFTKSNLIKLIDKFNLNNNEAVLYVFNNFDNIKLKFERLNKCLVYGRFSLDNLVVSNCCDEVFMLGFDSVKLGNRYEDIKSVFTYLSEEMKEVFEKEYGEVSAEEIIIDEVVSSIVTLYFAAKEEVFPSWAKGSLASLFDGSLLKNAKSLVNWY